jgi:hypothetical protein
VTSLDLDPTRAIRTFPILVIAAGMAGTLALALVLPSGVFFSGDGGVKCLLAEQLSEGDLHLDLRLPAEPWVAAIWDGGLYPFAPPYVYPLGGLRVLGFPVVFPVLTAPLVAAFGERGLLVLPLVALWAIWWGVLAVCRRIGLGPGPTLVAVAGVVFASHLPLYGVMYWEHTTAVFLASAAAWRVVFPGPRNTWILDGLWPGLALGLATWMRPEIGVMAVALGCWVAVRARREPARRAAAAAYFVAGAAVAAAVAGVNLRLSGLALGTHALQVVGAPTLASRLAAAAAILAALAPSLVVFVPLVVVPVVVLLASPRGGDPDDGLRPLVIVSLAFVVLTPLLLPNAGGRQWGPRYLLPVVPMFAVAAGLALARTARWRARGRRIIAGLAIIALVLGTAVNAVVGVRRCFFDGFYETVAGLRQVLRSEGAVVIAGSHQYVPQLLGAEVRGRRFFTLRKPGDLGRLLAAAGEHGVGTVYLVCPEFAPCDAAERFPQAELVIQRPEYVLYRLPSRDG